MAALDQAKPVRRGESLDVEKIAAYLKAQFPDLEGPAKIGQFHSGYSNLTYLLSVGDTQLVLRRPPLGKKAKTAHDMHREYRILRALKPVYPLVPAPLVYCEDPSVMGAPFYVMERLTGIILRKDLPAASGFDTAWAARLCRKWVDGLTALHRLDYRQCGLDGLGNPQGYVSRQIQGWSARYRDARTEDVPDFATVIDWLSDNKPPDHADPALIHNDYKFDNVVLDPDDPARIVGVLDWEMATIGDPLMDLGASLGYWIEAGDSDELKLIRTLPTLAPGMLTRREIVGLYGKLTGNRIDDFAWYYCFGLFRLAAIAQQIYYRYRNGQTTDARFQMLGLAVGILEKAARRVIETGDY